jgi:hypothetical protein
VVAHTVIPNFQHEGTWYNYLTGESLDVSGAGSIDLEAGEFAVFTDQDFGRPYVRLDITVLREEDNSPIHGAILQMQDMMGMITDVNGEASSLPVSNKTYQYTIQAGNVQATGTIEIGEEDLQETIKLKNVDAIDSQSLTKVKIYPNPAKDLVYLENAKGANLLIYNLKGQLVLQKKLNNQQISVSLKGLNSGVYILTLKNDDKTINRKLVIN